MGNDLEPSESPGPILRLPRPWWHLIFPGLLGLCLFSFAAAIEWQMVQPGPVTFKERGGGVRTVTRAERWPDITMWGLLMVLAPCVPLGYALTSSLVIRKEGLQISGARQQWPNERLSFTPWPLDWLRTMVRWYSGLRRQMFPIIPWKQISDCHWNRYTPGKLTMSGPTGLLFFAVPERHRAEVEAIFRRFGKWQD